MITYFPMIGKEPLMRDKRFVARHRGGPLEKERHRQLMKWARACAKHVLPLAGNKIDDRLLQALEVAKAWRQGTARVGEAQRASWAAHAAARESSDPAAIAVARAIGQAVATAHMADHSLGAAWYALRAVKAAGKSIEAERKWQDRQLPAEIKNLVLSARKSRNI
jgi:hypothetical protein